MSQPHSIGNSNMIPLSNSNMIDLSIFNKNHSIGNELEGGPIRCLRIQSFIDLPSELHSVYFLSKNEAEEGLHD